MSESRLLPFWGLLLIIFTYAYGVRGAAVMSVDLGNEWMKVGVVSPGVPMEIALNKESKRKTPAVLSFRDNIRTFGEDAQTVGVRFPSNAYGYLLDLLGKTVDNPIVELYKQRYPYYEIVGDEERNTVVFKNGEERFRVEELVAQILMKAKEFAEDSTNQLITECVLIVPGYFGQAERAALLSAAQLANLKVLQLINDYTAVALNYGVFNRAEINETAQYLLFYDMGAQKTSAAVVSYQLVKDKTTKEKNPTIQVLGVGYDRTLGGLEIQLRLRDYLAKEFNNMKKTKTDVLKNPRAMAKLFKEAGRVKNVLSANNDHYAQIENLIEDHDFKLQVNREKLEELCSDLWPRIVKPLQQALQASGLSLNVINQVILFGGGTRVPKVQEILREEIQQEPGKSLNADEAATMGAVYKAADLATGFKVKKFIIKDAVIFPIQVTFDRDTGEGVTTKQIKRILFGQMNSYPQKKVITFNKHTSDFDFYVTYGDLSHLSKEEIAYIGSLNLSHVELTKVSDIFEKNKGGKVESKGIKAHFALDDSGLFSLTGVDFVFEKEKIGEDDDDESAFSKLGSTISKLFSGDSGKDNIKEKETKDQENKEDQSEESDATNKTLPEEENDKSTKTESNKTVEEKDTEAPKNETVKIITVKEPVEHKLSLQFATPLSGEAYKKSLEKIENINKAESVRTRRESAFNALESHVIETQDKLGIREYASCATENEIETIRAECSSISDWLYEAGEGVAAEEYEKRLEKLQKMTNEVYLRHWEHDERPEALKALTGMIDGASKFLESAKNLTKEVNPEKDVFTQIEINTLQTAIEETVEWQKIETKEQAKLKRNENVRLTVKDITDKMALLDREVKYLVNKIKIWKPKPKPTKKNKIEKDENKRDNDSKDEPNNVVEEEQQPDKAEVPIDEVKTKEEEINTSETKADDDNEREPETQTPHGEL